MAHGHTTLDEADTQPIGAKLWPTFSLLVAAAIVGAALLAIGSFIADDSWRRFLFAYLIAYCFVLGLTVGSVALVILTHLFRAGWVVAVRRVPETFAANFWLMAALAIPLLPAVFDGKGSLYPWSASQEVVEEKLHAAEEFLHNRAHGHDGDHGHHGEEKEAAVDGEPTIYYTADSPDAHHAEGESHGSDADHADGYAAVTATLAGMAYDGATREENLEIQDAYYWTLLGYMLDYKRFGGKLAGDAQVPDKKGFTWFDPMLFALRLVIYFAVLSLIGWYYWTRSIRQDETKDPDLSTRREWWAPLSTTAFALTVTFMAFDVLMSLDPAWYSTMFGVIFFANSFTAGIAGTILVCMVLQKKGYLKTVTTEHYHDLGKLLFAFVFFWGYVSFSQFMLIWYASLPETTYWFEIHGMTTVKTAPQYGSSWTVVSLVMLFGHLLVPFGFLLSRHVKRNLTALAFAATWMLLMVYLDFFWYAMPFFNSSGVTFGLPEIGAVLALGGVVLAMFVRRYAKHAPLAHGDPRLHESTALDTNVWAPIHH